MRKTVLLPLLLVGLMVAGASFFSSSAYAQSASTSDQTGTSVAAPNTTTDTSSSSGSLLECTPFIGSKGVSGCLVQLVGSLILTFANFLLGVAGVLFNLVIFYGVFQFANTIGNAPGVLLAWGILRDLANMALLFGFIFMGIATILDTGAVQNFTAKRALPSLLIFAILMNFSLFTAEAMIDVSNAFASSIYTQANVAACASSDTSCVVNYGLAGNIMQSTGLAGIWKAGIPDLSPTQYLGLALFATIGAIVFFAASIMLAIRVIVLTFLMIVSPIGFAGMAIPPLRRFAGDWWQNVIHQAFYAPIMLLLILISLKISENFLSGESVNNGLGTTIGNAVTDPNASTISVVLVFMLVIGFLIASLIFANRFGAAGASLAVKTAGRFTLGAYGSLGRNTAGRGFHSINERIRNSEFGQTRVGRRVALLAEKGAKASYDPRGTKTIAALGKRIGDLGKPPEGGFSGSVKRQTDAYSNYAKTLQQTPEAKAQEEELKEQKATIIENKESENQRWNKEKEEREAEIAALKNEISAREKERSDQADRVAAALASGDRAAFRGESDRMEKLMLAHKDLDEEANKKIEKSTSVLETGRKQHENSIREFDEKVKEIDLEIKGDIEKGIAGVDANSSKRAFAIDLKNSSIPGKGKARDKAIEAIKSELKKSKTERAIEGLKASIDANKGDTVHKLDEVEKTLKEEGHEKKEEAGGESGHH